jgi:acyl-CoA synthetase (AMP-forming)/AMP-acid ligase II
MRQILDAPSAFLPHIWANHARHFPNREAVVCGGTRWSWRRFNEAMNQVANGLLGLGVGQGDAVAVVMTNSAEMAAVLFGIVKSGACAVPISALLSPEQIAGMIADSDAQALFADANTRPLVEPVQSSLARIRRNGFFALGFEAQGWRGLADWMAPQRPRQGDQADTAGALLVRSRLIAPGILRM